MAVGTFLKLKFGTMSGEKTFTYKYGDEEATSANINALMDGIIANGSIFKNPPLTKISAVCEITSQTSWDMT